MDDGHSADDYIIFLKGHPCKFPTLSEVSGQSARKEVAQFVREYFASATVSHMLLDKIVSFCEDSSQQQILGDILCTISSHVRKCHFRKSNHNALKYIVEQLEIRHAEIGWQLYSCLTNSIMDKTAHVDRVYFDEYFSKYIIVQENRYQLSQGTTGLSCWQASCDLANYLLKHGRDYISGRNILELGAGCGLLGIALAASGFTKSITLSDGCVDVLNVIRDNIWSNFSENCDIFNVIFLEWETVNVENIPVVPDVIFAADVVYDTLTIKPLVRTIRKLLVAFTKEIKTGPFCLLANTIRNQETMDQFLACAGENGLSVRNCFIYENSVFKFATRNVEDHSLFPFTSSIQCPTIFHELILKD
ncbi:membrane protein, variant [Loa loa]|uniref:Membrane protein n=1 Tax=Loa loa TaxID=7209 RepID=A0A1S0UBD0_LOALO|nr:membrane protein [Loa loa]XP_020307103.1 membrane protein, variant [Loa loa]EFO27205.2 membrane protein [Loa loa]EJD76293.1 membrane protein, variant [Loa loa]